MSFGAKLKALRIEQRRSQEYVAGCMGISQSYLGVLEQREFAPRQEVLEILAEYYGLPVVYFYTGIDKCPMCGYIFDKKG